MTPEQQDRLRSLPSIDDLVQRAVADDWLRDHSRARVVSALRDAVDEVRRRILANGIAADDDTATILAAARRMLADRRSMNMRRVINATGVVLHTGLGRAPLCPSALRAIAEVAAGYTNLELDLATGARGSRVDHVRSLLYELTGAESAVVVNNNAAAMSLIMRALCAHREVIVSRGQLVEIGGSFRMPEVMAGGGARLREVGTTNRTRLSDYESAVTEETAAILRVHTSNFRIVGFTHQPPLAELCACAHRRGLVMIDDLGSGALCDPQRFNLPDEPTVAASVAAGCDLIAFSADKLLGGPQAGIVVGRRALIERLETHPLMRTYRVDKLVLLALEATLRHYLEPDEAAREIPVWSMLCASEGELQERATRLRDALQAALPDERFTIERDHSVAGGGSLPGEGIETVVIRFAPVDASCDETLKRLRRSDPPVVARIHRDAVCFDLRTIREHEVDSLVAATASAVAARPPSE